MSGPQFENTPFAGFAAEVVKTREFQKFLNSILSDTLNTWGGKGEIKSEIAKHAKRILRRRLPKSGGGAEHEDLIDLLQNQQAVEYVRQHLPDLINGMMGLTELMAASLKDASEDEQKDFYKDIFNTFDSDKIGSTFSSLTETIDILHRNHPTFFADQTVQILNRVLANIDFGDLKIAFENSESDFKALIKKFNDLLFEYPAKLILILSFVPGISNHLIFFIEDLLKRFNALPADILTDLLISFFKEVDEKTVGELLNNLAEFIRQVHTGSALTGDSGTPYFSTELARKTRTVLNEVDAELLFKAGNAIVDGKEALIKSLYDAACENPEFPELALKHMAVRENAKNRMTKRKIEMLEDLSGEDEAAAISAGLSEWNAFEFAELINSVCGAANILHQHSPDGLKHAVLEFVNTLDLYEIEESVTWISHDLTQTLKPLLQTVLPVVIKDVIGCLTEDTEDNAEQIAEMRTLLRRFIMNEETC